MNTKKTIFIIGSVLASQLLTPYVKAITPTQEQNSQKQIQKANAISEQIKTNLIFSDDFDNGLSAWKGIVFKDKKVVEYPSMLRIKQSKSGGNILVLTIDIVNKEKKKK